MFGKKKSVAGLDIGSSSVKMVELEGKNGRYSLYAHGFENLPDETIVDGQIMELNTVSDVIQKVCQNHGIKAERVVTGVSGHSVIIKNITLPPMSDEEAQKLGLKTLWERDVVAKHRARMEFDREFDRREGLTKEKI